MEFPELIKQMLLFMASAIGPNLMPIIAPRAVAALALPTRRHPCYVLESFKVSTCDLVVIVTASLRKTASTKTVPIA